MNDEERRESETPFEYAFSKLKSPHCVSAQSEKPKHTASSEGGATNATRRTPGLTKSALPVQREFK